MGLGELSPWHLLILAAVVLVLFGAKKLPDSARSLGRAMRIFKAETSGLRDGDKGEDNPSSVQPPSSQQLPPATARVENQANAAPVAEAQHSNHPS